MRVVLLSALLYASAIFAAPLPPEVVGELHKRFPNQKADPDLVAVGDLNGDGLLDFATFIGDPYTGDDLRVIVLLGTSAKTFQVHSVSGFIPGDLRRVPANWLEFKKGTLLLHRNGSNGAPSDWNESFQFQMRGGDLVLIGETSTTIGNSSTVENNGTSVNYLTNEVLFWRQAGHKRREVRKSFSNSEPTKLGEFDYDAHYKHSPRILHGFLDEHFRLRQ